MLKRFTAFLLITALLSTGFSRLFVYAGFEANAKLIAAKLCENKNKPQMHCLGKCYLKKKLKQAEEKEKDSEKQGQKTQQQNALIVENLRLVSPFILLSIASTPEHKFHLPNLARCVFQPPQV